jgi:hypothetical protein
MISQMFEAAAKVANEWSLAAFTVAALVLIVLLTLRRKSTPKNTIFLLGAIVVAMVILAVVPLVSRAYLESHGIYRLRVTVEDSQGMPVDDAQVTSSIGGEPKRVTRGWEFDIPVASKPRDGKMTVYAAVANAFLSGTTNVQLANDYSLTAKIRLDHDLSAHIRGRVIDRKGNPVATAEVSVVGYESEAVTTGGLGEFELPAHASRGQQVQLAAFKKGFGSVSEWEQAGDQPATLVLGHQ